jgi:hypothetical protein
MTDARREGPVATRYMRAYYHEFAPTGCDRVDAILEAIAKAGKAYHSTSGWSESVGGDDSGPSYWDAIQQAANDAAGRESVAGDCGNCGASAASCQRDTGCCFLCHDSFGASHGKDRSEVAGRAVAWLCQTCDRIWRGERPDICIECKAGGKPFRTTPLYAATPPAAGLGEKVEALMAVADRGAWATEHLRDMAVAIEAVRAQLDGRRDA